MVGELRDLVAATAVCMCVYVAWKSLKPRRQAHQWSRRRLTTTTGELAIHMQH